MPSRSGRPCGSPDHAPSRRAFLGAAAGLAGLALPAPALAERLRRDQKRGVSLQPLTGAWANCSWREA